MPRCMERPRIAICCLEWLERLKLTSDWFGCVLFIPFYVAKVLEFFTKSSSCFTCSYIYIYIIFFFYLNEIMSQSVAQSVNYSAGQLAIQPVNQSVSQSTSQSVSLPVSQLVSRSVCQFVSYSYSQSANQLAGNLVYQIVCPSSINRVINRLHLIFWHVAEVWWIIYDW